jgi:ABC-2 type transport system permease protein
MLWYKGWLETRFRLLFLLVTLGSFLVFFSMAARAPVSGPTKPIVGFVSFSVPGFVVMMCAMLAGAGIVTQPSLQAAKGLHGSTLFTLSLPVSRFRLLAVRAGLGWLEMAGAIGVLCCGIWFAFPDLRATAKATEMFQYAATLMACASALYFISVLAGTFLDDLWRTWGTMIAAVGLWWLSSHTPLGESIDVFRAMGEGSPLIAHTMPWDAVAFSLALATILLFAALKVVRTREY